MRPASVFYMRCDINASQNHQRILIVRCLLLLFNCTEAVVISFIHENWTVIQLLYSYSKYNTELRNVVHAATPS